VTAKDGLMPKLPWMARLRPKETSLDMLGQVNDANLTAGNNKETNAFFTEASILEEPGAVVPLAGVC